MAKKKSSQNLKDQSIADNLDDKFRLIANCTPILIWISTKEPVCAFVNQSWLDFTGRTFKDELGEGWADSIHPEDLSRVIDFFGKAFKEQKPCEIEYRLKRSDDEYRWMLDKAVPYFNKNQQFQGFVGSCVDITPQKQLEYYRNLEVQRLTLFNDRLMKLNSELEDFTNIVAHDFKAPLRHLLLYTEMIKSDLDLCSLSENSRYALEMIEGVVTKTHTLLDNLWILATRGSPSLTFEKISLDHLVHKVLDEFSLDLAQIDAEVSVEPLATITCCPPLMEQVFQNLLQNAIKFRQKDRKLHITIGAEENEINWLFYVKDNGVGIAPQFIHSIFAPFKQILPNNDGEEGMGIGLSICKKIIAIHMGEIWVSSEGMEKGSTFYFTIPKVIKRDS